MSREVDVPSTVRLYREKSPVVVTPAGLSVSQVFQSAVPSPPLSVKVVLKTSSERTTSSLEEAATEKRKTSERPGTALPEGEAELRVITGLVSRTTKVETPSVAAASSPISAMPEVASSSVKPDPEPVALKDSLPELSPSEKPIRIFSLLVAEPPESRSEGGTFTYTLTSFGVPTGTYMLRPLNNAALPDIVAVAVPVVPSALG